MNCITPGGRNGRGWGRWKKSALRGSTIAIRKPALIQLISGCIHRVWADGKAPTPYAVVSSTRSPLTGTAMCWETQRTALIHAAFAVATQGTMSSITCLILALCLSMVTTAADAVLLDVAIPYCHPSASLYSVGAEAELRRVESISHPRRLIMLASPIPILQTVHYAVRPVRPFFHVAR